MKLYWFRSLSPQKVRLALNELELEHELVTVDLFKREQRTPEFLADCCMGPTLDALSSTWIIPFPLPLITLG